MIFVTVGTLTPFDRLVQGVDALAERGYFAGEDVFAQIGDGGYEPKHLSWAHSLNRDDFQATVKRSRAIISHAGMGTIISALTTGRPLLVFPRMRRFGEHVNDHQVATAKEFEAARQVLAAYSTDTLKEKIRELASFRAVPRQANPEVVSQRIIHFLRDLKPRPRN